VANKRTAYARDRANEIRFLIISALGGFCAECGSPDRIELDHIDPSTRTWVAREHSQLGRAKRYWKDFENGLIQLLCKKCNLAKRYIDD
jgi:5-methylcytosine-specific restriction endonuclease McrA